MKIERKSVRTIDKRPFETPLVCETSGERLYKKPNVECTLAVVTGVRGIDRENMRCDYQY